MPKREKKEDKKTVLLKKHVWKEIHNIKVNEEYNSISDVVEDMLKKRKPKK